MRHIWPFAGVHGREREHFRDYKAVLRRFKVFQSVSGRAYRAKM
jgi:hypothetical protein